MPNPVAEERLALADRVIGGRFFFCTDWRHLSAFQRRDLY